MLKSNELVARLNVLRQQPHVDALELARIKAEAKKLLRQQSDAVAGYAVLGIVYQMEGNETESLRNFDAAVRLSANDLFVEINRAIALTKFGHLRAGLRVAELAYQRDPLDLDLLRTAAMLCSGAGRVRRLMEISDKWKALSPNSDMPVPDSETLRPIAARLDEMGISDDDVSEYLESAANVLKSKDILWDGTRSSYLPDASILFRFLTLGGEKRASEGSEILTDFKVERGSPALDEAVTVTCEAT